jgi:thiamine-phosphate diphosphorylase
MGATVRVGPPVLHVVTDDEILARPDFRDAAWAVFEAGGPDVALHVRGPATRGGRLLEVGEALRPAAAASGSRLIVNDRVDVAALVGAHGVHLGRRSLPPGVARGLLAPGVGVGRSAHSPEEAEAAATEGADWIFIGTVYPTASHPGRPGGGPEMVRRAVSAAGPVPVFAIGGVSPSRVAELLAQGAAGVVAMRGIWDAQAPPRAVEGYLQALAARAGAATTPQNREPS